MRDKLAAAEIPAASLRCYVTPRRLAIVAEGIPATQPDRTEERRGPRVGAPPQAIEGFLRSAGLGSVEECEIRDTGRGEFYFAVIRRSGPGRRRDIARADRGRDRRTALAEIDALAGLGAALGAALDLDHLPL